MEWEEVFSLAEEVAPYAVELRHELHRVPELALQEYKTTAILRRELETMDVERDKPHERETQILVEEL